MGYEKPSIVQVMDEGPNDKVIKMDSENNNIINNIVIIMYLVTLKVMKKRRNMFFSKNMKTILK